MSIEEYFKNNKLVLTSELTKTNGYFLPQWHTKVILEGKIILEEYSIIPITNDSQFLNRVKYLLRDIKLKEIL